MTQSMPPQAPQELVAQLQATEPNTRARALAALVLQGAAATPALLDALPQAPPPVRAQIARALAEIADPRTVDALAALLADTDPLVRGRGAQGLARLNDPRALDALVRTLDDLPDVLHWPFTVSAYLLVERGEAALPQVLPLLLDEAAERRQRAFAVLQAVLAQSRGDAGWQALWAQCGRYDPLDADATRRVQAARLWAQWLQQR